MEKTSHNIPNISVDVWVFNNYRDCKLHLRTFYIAQSSLSAPTTSAVAWNRCFTLVLIVARTANYPAIKTLARNSQATRCILPSGTALHCTALYAKWQQLRCVHCMSPRRPPAGSVRDAVRRSHSLVTIQTTCNWFYFSSRFTRFHLASDRRKNSN